MVKLEITEENGLQVTTNPVVIEVVNATAPGSGSNIVYQRAESLTTDISVTLTDQSIVLTVGPDVTLTLPDCATNDGQQITVVAGASGTIVAAAGSDTIGVTETTYPVPVNNVRTFTSSLVGAAHTWLVTNANGNASDIPTWVGQSITQGYVVRMGASAPEWGVASTTPTAHASTHAATGSDAVSLAGTQITSGIIAPARLGSGTSDSYHFLDGSGTWTDNVPVLVPCKNTSGSALTKATPVYITGTVGATAVVEIAPADADDAAKMPALGLLAGDIAVNGTGYVVTQGIISDVNTASYTVNTPLYVSTTAGQLTSTKPAGSTSQIQAMARVGRVNTNSGTLVVIGAGQAVDDSNAINASNLTTGTVAYARLPIGTTASTVAAGDDSRLSNSRTPTAHASTHAAAGTDSLALSATQITSAVIGTARLASTGTASASTFLRGDQSWSAPTTIANDTLWDAAGDLAVGSGADTAAKLSKGTRTQALVVGASTLEWDANHYNGGNALTATESAAIAETLPAGTGFGAVAAPGASGVAHLHAIYLPKGVTVTYITFVSGATAAGTPTNQWFALADSSRTILRVTGNDTTVAWNSSTAKKLTLTSSFTTTYSGKHYLVCVVTATTMPSFRGANAGTFTGVLTESFTSTTGLTTPSAEGTTLAASTGRVATVMGIVS